MEYNYTWKSDYILPYESMYSIREKFCYLNAVTWPYFIKVRKCIEGTEKFGQIYYYSGLGANTIPGYSLPSYYEIRYCPLCLLYGYHSVFHQALPFRTCFVHKKQSLIRYKWHYAVMRTDDTILYDGLFFNTSPRIENIIQPKPLLIKLNGISDVLKNIKNLSFYDTNYYDQIDDRIVYNSTSKFMHRLFEGKHIIPKGVSLILDKSECCLIRKNPSVYYHNSTADIVSQFIENMIKSEFEDYREYFNDIFNLEDDIKFLCQNRCSKYATIIIIYSMIYKYNETLYYKYMDLWLKLRRPYINVKNRIVSIMDELEHLKNIKEKGYLRDNRYWRNIDVFKEAILKDSFYYAKKNLTEYLKRHLNQIIKTSKNIFLTKKLIS